MERDVKKHDDRKREEGSNKGKLAEEGRSRKRKKRMKTQRQRTQEENEQNVRMQEEERGGNYK